MESAPRDPEVLRSARKHGIADLDAQHAYRNAIDVFEVNDDMTMYIGPARDGSLLEVGAIQAADHPEYVLIARDESGSEVSKEEVNHATHIARDH